MDRDTISNLYRGPSIDVSYQVSVHLGVSEEKIKMWNVDGRTTDDGRKVMAFRPGELKNDMILCTSVCILPSFLEHPYRHFDRASKLRIRIRFHHFDQERLHLQKTCDTGFGERFKLRSGDSTQINIIWYRRFSSANRDAYFQLKIRVKYGQSAVEVNGLKASHGWCGSSVTLWLFF